MYLPEIVLDLACPNAVAMAVATLAVSEKISLIEDVAGGPPHGTEAML
jgi:hypothetical protein